MVTDSRHIIRQQIFELSLEGEKGARDIQDEVGDVFKSRILPRMEQIFDRLSVPGQVLKIDSLELDLGDIDLRYLKEDMPLKVEQLLEEEITKAIYQQQEGIYSDISSISVGWSEAKLEAFQYLIRTGVHPWNSTYKDQSVSQLFEVLAEQHPTQVKQIMTRELAHEYVQKRVTYQFSEDQFRQLVSLILGSQDQPMLALLIGLQLLGKQLPALSSRSRTWDEEVKANLLQVIAHQSSKSAPKAVWVQQMFTNLMASWAGTMRRSETGGQAFQFQAFLLQILEKMDQSLVKEAFGPTYQVFHDQVAQQLFKTDQAHESSDLATGVIGEPGKQQGKGSAKSADKSASSSDKKRGVTPVKDELTNTQKATHGDAVVPESDGNPSQKTGKEARSQNEPVSKPFAGKQQYTVTASKGLPDSEQSDREVNLLKGAETDKASPQALEKEGDQKASHHDIEHSSGSEKGDGKKAVNDVAEPDKNGSETTADLRDYQENKTSEKGQGKSNSSESMSFKGEAPTPSDADPEPIRKGDAKKGNNFSDRKTITIEDEGQQIQKSPTDHKGKALKGSSGSSEDARSEVSGKENPDQPDSIEETVASTDQQTETHPSNTLDSETPINLRNRDVPSSSADQKGTPSRDADQHAQGREGLSLTEDEDTDSLTTDQRKEVQANAPTGEHDEKVQSAISNEKVNTAASPQSDGSESERDNRKADGSGAIPPGQDTRPTNRIVPHPEDRFRSPIWRRPPVIIEEAHISNAGLALLWPYLPILFKGLNWVKDGAFVSEERQFRALHFLQYLATGEVATDEQELTFNKLLVGLQPEMPVPFDVALAAEELEEAEHLLKTVLESWKALKSGSVDLLRHTFLQKEGLMKKDMASWKLYVERSAYDILLDRLPWSYSIVKLPWMDNLINVEW